MRGISPVVSIILVVAVAVAASVLAYTWVSSVISSASQSSRESAFFPSLRLEEAYFDKPLFYDEFETCDFNYTCTTAPSPFYDKWYLDCSSVFSTGGDPDRQWVACKNGILYLHSSDNNNVRMYLARPVSEPIFVAMLIAGRGPSDLDPTISLYGAGVSYYIEVPGSPQVSRLITNLGFTSGEKHLLSTFTYLYFGATTGWAYGLYDGELLEKNKTVTITDRNVSFGINSVGSGGELMLDSIYYLPFNFAHAVVRNTSTEEFNDMITFTIYSSGMRVCGALTKSVVVPANSVVRVDFSPVLGRCAVDLRKGNQYTLCISGQGFTDCKQFS